MSLLDVAGVTCLCAAPAFHSQENRGPQYDEAVAGLEALGDTGVTQDPHGSAKERKDALLTGYHGLPGQTKAGDPVACILTYWK
jgi:hypothetical protein